MNSALSFLPKNFITAVKFYLKKLLGVIIIIIAMVYAVALASYHSTDPAFNYSSDVGIQNWLGSLGAYISDMSFHIGGVCAYFLSFILLSWGVGCLNDNELRKLIKRIFWLVPTLFILSLAINASAQFFNIGTGFPTSAGIGGVMGWMAAPQFMFSFGDGAVEILQDILPQNMLIFVINIFTNFYTRIILVWFFVASAVVLFFYECGLKPREYWQMVQFIIKIISFMIIVLTAPFRMKRAFAKVAMSLKKLRAVRFRAPSFRFFGFLKFGSSKSVGASDDVLGDGVLGDDVLSGDGLKDRLKDSGGVKNVLGRKSDLVGVAKPSLKSDSVGISLPSLSLLESKKGPTVPMQSESAMEETARMLERVLDDFGIKGQITGATPGPVVTLYELQPAAGTKVSKIVALSDDIARSMSALSVRVATIPGRPVIGIELPNSHRSGVFFRSLLESDDFQNSTAVLPLVLGADIGGLVEIADLSSMPHLLIAGTTGSGKSVGLNSMILSLLYSYTAQDCRLIMIDPKMLELSVYDDIPHLLTPVVTDPKRAIVALKWAVREMDERYSVMTHLSVRNIDGYNSRIRAALLSGESLSRKVQVGFDDVRGLPIYEDEVLELEVFPYIVIVIDEMADLMLIAGKEIEVLIQRLSQKARAAGIHLIMATQRPSVDVITGTIKSNFPTRISFMVVSRIDSRTILGEHGAEQLLGKGDMLFMQGGSRIKRVHGAFVDDSDVASVCNFLRSLGFPRYIDDVIRDDDDGAGVGSDSFDDDGDVLYDRAVEIILTEGRASTSLIQRHLQIGYNRAARIMDMMERRNVVSAANNSGKREILQ